MAAIRLPVKKRLPAKRKPAKRISVCTVKGCGFCGVPVFDFYFKITCKRIDYFYCNMACYIDFLNEDRK